MTLSVMWEDDMYVPSSSNHEYKDQWNTSDTQYHIIHKIQTNHKWETVVTRSSVELLVLVTSVDIYILPFYQANNIFAGDWLPSFGVVKARSSENKHVLLPSTLFSIPDLKLSLQLGKDVIYKQLLMWTRMKQWQSLQFTWKANLSITCTYSPSNSL